MRIAFKVCLGFFFLGISLTTFGTKTVDADYNISCGDEISVTCPCDQCPAPDYVCPGETQCLRIGCYCDPTADNDGDGLRGACLRNEDNPTWNSCCQGECPGDEPPPGGGGSCSGACFAGIANCGVVGRPSGSGTCPGPGELCCGQPGGGAAICSATLSPNPIDIFPGQMQFVRGLTGGIPNPYFDASFYASNPSVAYNQPTEFSGFPSGPPPYDNYYTILHGLSPGTGVLDFIVYNEDNRGQIACQDSVAYTVHSGTPYARVTLTPNPVDMMVGESKTLTAHVETTGGLSVNYVLFYRQSGYYYTYPGAQTPLAQGLGTRVGSSNDFTIDVTGLSQGSGGVFVALAVLSNTTAFEASTVINVGSVGPWWQAQGASVFTNGNLSSQIASSCVLPGCNPAFILNSTGSYPGIPIYAGLSYDFAAGTTSGVANSRNWLSRTRYSGSTYEYNYVNSILTSDIIFNPLGNSINASSLNTGTESQGYYWYRAPTSTIVQNITIPGNRKVVLLLDGDLTINGNLSYASNSTSFLLIIVRGNININPSVSNISAVLLTNGSLRTGSSNTRLNLFGSVAAHGGISFQRDLLAGNSSQAAEFFDYDPKIPLVYPRALVSDFILWREVAP